MRVPLQWVVALPLHPAPIHDMSAHATERSKACMHTCQICVRQNMNIPPPSLPTHFRMSASQFASLAVTGKKPHGVWKFVYVKPQIAPNSAYVTPCTVPRLSCFMHTHRARTVPFHSRTHTIFHWIFWYVLMSSCQTRIKRRDDMVRSTQQIVA